MGITVLGFILVPISIILFIYKPDNLIYILIFFTPFTASSIYNNPRTSTGVQPVFFIGSLWMLYLVIKIVRYGVSVKFKWDAIINSYNKTFNKVQKRFILAIVILWAIALISLIMPILLRNRIYISPPEGTGVRLLTLRKINFTQFVYLTFVLITPIFTMFHIQSLEKFYKCIKTFLISTLFTTLWGFYQFLSHYLHIQYAYSLFNNNIAYYQGWAQTVGGIKRVCSVSTEPSTYALFMSMMISFIIIFWINDMRLLSKKLTITLLVCSIASILLTTSTTAYVAFAGIIIVIIMFYYVVLAKFGAGLDFRQNGLKLVKLISFTALGIIIIVVIYLVVFRIQPGILINMIKDISINKFSVQSGVERKAALLNGIDIFRFSPILGVGWASNRTLDLITNLLSNIGILGFAAFAAVVYIPIRSSSHILLNSKSKSISTFALGLLLSLTSGLFCLMVSIPDIIFVYFWIMVGLSMSMEGIVETK